MPGMRVFSTESPRPPRQGGGQRPGTHGPESSVPDVPRVPDSADSEDEESYSAEALGRLVAAGPGEDAVLLLEDYFVGNPEAFAYEAEDGWRVSMGHLDADVLGLHLAGRKTIGTFPLRADDTTTFVVWDVDTLDPTPIAQLVGVLRPPYLVEHTGGRGRHIWQHFTEPVNAGLVLEYGTAMLARAGVTAEVYPKQAQRNSGLGNLIRIPLGVSRGTGVRSHFEFGELRRVPFNGLYSRGGEHSGSTTAGGQGREDWIESLYSGHAPDGRNNGLNRLAYWLMSRGFPSEVVVAAVLTANDTFEDPLSEDELMRTVLRERRG